MTWIVTNGSFNSGVPTTTITAPLTSPVSVFWNDVAGNGSIRATSNCTEGALVVNQSYAIKSLAGRTLGNPHTFQTPQLCSTASIQIGVDVMFLQNTGGATGITQQRADGYEWALPAGWSYGGVTGTVSTPEEYISISPNSGCIVGSVTVKAYMNCTSGRKYSSSSSISLARPSPAIYITAPAGYPGPGCGSTTPVTFTVNHTISCLAANNAFQWVFPSGWNVNGLFTSSNTITATPSGGANDGILGGNLGKINVTITLACGTQLAATPYQLIYVTPTIISSSPICEFGSTVTMANIAPSVAVNWSVSSNMSIYSGQGTTSAVMKAHYVGSIGYGTIAATVNCPGTFVSPIDVWIGSPSQPGPISGNTTPNIGSIYQYVATIGSQGAVNYDWILPYNGNPRWSVANGTVSGPVNTLVPNFFAGSSAGKIQIFAQNVCGNSGTSKLFVTPEEGPCIQCPRIAQDNKAEADTTFAKIVLYPNPASTECKVRLTIPAEHEGELSLIDFSGNVKRNGVIQKGAQWITIGTSDINPGLYVVRISVGSKETYKKVLVQH